MAFALLLHLHPIRLHLRASTQLFLERGCCKTSLANVFSSFVPNEDSKHNLLSTRINCDVKDTLRVSGEKLLRRCNSLENNFHRLSGSRDQKTYGISDFFPHETINPDEVRRALARISTSLWKVISKPVIFRSRVQKQIRAAARQNSKQASSPEKLGCSFSAKFLDF